MGKGKGHIPIRTCISCRTKRSKYDLVRFIPDNKGHIIRYSNGKIHGRSIYVCHAVDCQAKLKGNKRLNKLFGTDRKITVGPDLDEQEGRKK